LVQLVANHYLIVNLPRLGIYGMWTTLLFFWYFTVTHSILEFLGMYLKESR